MNVVYTKDNCPYCVKAKALLKSYGIAYAETVIGKDITREEFLDIFPTAKTVPQIILDGERIGGYSEVQTYLERQTK